MSRELSDTELDAALAVWRVSEPSPDLRRRALTRTGSARSRGWLAAWGFGAGLVAACGAGAVVGATLSREMTPGVSEQTLGAVLADYDLPVAPDSGDDV